MNKPEKRKTIATLLKGGATISICGVHFFMKNDEKVHSDKPDMIAPMAMEAFLEKYF